MEVSVKRGKPRDQKTGCIIVAVHAGKTLSAAAHDLDKASRGAIRRLVDRGDLGNKPGDTVMLPDVHGIKGDRVLLVAAGRRNGLSPDDYRKLVTGAAAALTNARIRNAVSCLVDVDVRDRDLEWKLDQHVLVTAAAAYRFDEMKSKPGRPGLARLAVLCADDATSAMRAAARVSRAKAHGVAFAKDLANRPGNVCTPTYLAEQAEELANRTGNLDVSVLEESDMETLGMGSLLSVARGSREPAKLIVFEYRGGEEDAAPIVLVGKGVTFDSGGISIKPGPAMDEMKYDMCGAASVFGTMAAVAELAPAINVVGIVPATENLPDGNASKPGDIVTSMSGQTIEILNTDAEGRLILCDALTYCARFEPDVVVDIATLTGACVVALGAHASGLMSHDDALADALLEAGERSGDRAWRLPLWDDYQQQIESPFADMANVGGREAGSVTAACFLSRFTSRYRWAHLDIAGSAWTSGKNKGATGRPVPLLLEYILSRAG